MVQDVELLAERFIIWFNEQYLLFQDFGVVFLRKSASLLVSVKIRFEVHLGELWSVDCLWTEVTYPQGFIRLLSH